MYCDRRDTWTRTQQRNEDAKMNVHATRTLAVVLTFASGLLVVGCSIPANAPLPPRSVSEYELVPPDENDRYPRYTVLLFNLQRTLDAGLAECDRLASFSLVERLGTKDPEARGHLAGIPSDPNEPDELRLRVASFIGAPPPVTITLASQDYAWGNPARRTGMDGDSALAGAGRDRNPGVSSGSVYLFRPNDQSWKQQLNSAIPDARSGGRLGERSDAFYGKSQQASGFYD